MSYAHTERALMNVAAGDSPSGDSPNAEVIEGLTLAQLVESVINYCADELPTADTEQSAEEALAEAQERLGEIAVTGVAEVIERLRGGDYATVVYWSPRQRERFAANVAARRRYHAARAHGA
jgi:hypothetical protein